MSQAAVPTPHQPPGAKPPNGSAATTPSPATPVLPLSALVPSKTNPRKKFEGPEFDGLVDSIRQLGVLEPLIVRPFRGFIAGTGAAIDGKFEVVAGERRYRAAQKAGLKELPVRVMALSDREALEFQVVENQQREDVSPLEEARGYSTLLGAMQREDPKTSRQKLVEQLAARIGMSARYVYARMKLVELAPEVVKALEEGKITASHADEIVRLQKPEQSKALKFCTQQREQYSSRTTPRQQPPPIREFKKFLASDLLVSLEKAPFDLEDAKLVPAAGACIACPKMAANDPLNVGSGVPGKTCLDPACFQAKKLAVVNISVAEITRKKGAAPVLLSEDYDPRGKKRQPGVLYQGEYDEDGYRAGAYRKVRPEDGDCVKLGLFVDGDQMGKTVLVCTRARNCPNHRYTPSRTPSGGKEKKRRDEMKTRRRAIAAIFAKVKSEPAVGELKAIAECLAGRIGHDIAKALCQALGYAPENKGVSDARGLLEGKIRKMERAELWAMLVALAVAEDAVIGSYGGSAMHRLGDVAKVYKVDLPALREQVKAERAAKTKKPKPAQTSAKKGQPAKKPAAAKKAKGGR